MIPSPIGPRALGARSAAAFAIVSFATDAALLLGDAAGVSLALSPRSIALAVVIGTAWLWSVLWTLPMVGAAVLHVVASARGLREISPLGDGRVSPHVLFAAGLVNACTVWLLFPR